MISTAYGSDLLKLTFNGTSIPGLADNAASSPLTSLYWTLHTGDPGAGGNQSTSEVSYTGWSRLSAARTSGGFTITGVQMRPTANVDFAEMTGGTAQTATHMTIGTAASGAGKVLFRFVLSTPIALNTNVTPRLRTDTTLTAVTS